MRNCGNCDYFRQNEFSYLDGECSLSEKGNDFFMADDAYGVKPYLMVAKKFYCNQHKKRK